MRLLTESRVANINKPQRKEGELEKFSPAIFKRW